MKCLLMHIDTVRLRIGVSNILANDGKLWDIVMDPGVCFGQDEKHQPNINLCLQKKNSVCGLH